MSFTRRTPLWGSLALAFVCIAGAAQAGDLERCRLQVSDQGKTTKLDRPISLGLTGDVGVDRLRAPDQDELVPLGDLRLAADFHPETDRWTERHNRIRISFWTGVWGWSGEMDIDTDMVLGLRLAWEVPGFIGIRIDSGVVPWSRLEVRAPIVAPAGFAGNPASKRHMSGFVHNHTLSLGIFNPELSVEGLAFWAGFGGGLWFYEYHENDMFGTNSGIDGDWSDVNISGHVFIEFDYKIVDILHVGIGLREHFVLADHTDEGRFYSFNGIDQSFDTGRNDGILDDLALVTELTFNISVLF